MLESGEEAQRHLRSVVGAYDAKTHLPKLLDRVEQGDVIVITRNGVAVARLAPLRPRKPQRSPDELRAHFRDFRRSHPLAGMTTRDLINEGRRV